MGIYNNILARLSQPDANHTATAVPAVRSLQDTAMAALGAHVMLADANNVIVYMNASVEQMLRHAEADIRQDLPHFEVDRLIGATMDVFHRNPAHQQALLSRLTRPHEANIRVGGRHFTLNATPLFVQGARVGTAVEWRDNTETMVLREREQALQAEQQARSVELGIIRTALDRVSANVMMADNDGTIFFANESVLKLLRTAESDMRRELPDFRADQVVGGSFDRFHRNTSHQRNLLARLQGPHEANITVGVRKFRLLASPVFGADGQRLGTVVEWQDRTDELRMEQAVDQALAQAIAGDLSGQIDHSGYSPFLGGIARGINELIATFSKVLGDAESSLEALAQGDLQRSIGTTYSGRYERLKHNINSTIAHLAKVVGEIDMATDSVKQSSQEISMGNMNLSQRTEEQAASLEQTTAAMSEITQTVEQNSNNARLANELAKEARSTAEDGGQVVSKAIAAMHAISDSSKRIEEIIQVIDEIAFQTNLLALNAAVEAARAGDQGRGFAVVADEVRNLASRSARAAKEIKGLINDSGSKVQEGATLVNRSGETLTCIIQSVKKVNDVVGEIAENSTEQARSLEEINKAVQEMDDMTQQNAALVEEAAAASESLYGQAEALSRLMEFFRSDSRSKGHRDR